MADGPSHIQVRGAREHNLRDVDVDIPRGKLVVLCGVSGSGKSTLAFDTIYAEGQRRYVESLSAYARQFLGQIRKPDVDSITGLSPSVAINQKTTTSNPRSTVGTVTEIQDHLRLLYARAGVAHCPVDNTPLGAADLFGVVTKVVALGFGTKVVIGATVVKSRKGTMKPELQALRKKGFSRVRVDGHDSLLEDLVTDLDKNLRHDIDVLIDRVTIKDGVQRRVSDSVQVALEEGAGEAFVEVLNAAGSVVDKFLVSAAGACVKCGVSYPRLEPRSFSFNSPFGACTMCEGLGSTYQGDESLIVPDPTRSLASGALAPWNTMSGGYQRWVLEALCKADNIDANIPWSQLPVKHKTMILDGVSGARVTTWQGRRQQITFEGVRPWLLRRLGEAQTDKQREAVETFMRSVQCVACSGQRLAPYPLAVDVAGASIADVCAMTVDVCADWFDTIVLTDRQQQIADRVVKEVCARLKFLKDVGLGYLTIDRAAKTLSGGEAQRISLASQVGAGLAGVLYVLDEPSIGLHPQDNVRLIHTLEHLRDLGNTVLVVEHDEETIMAADWVIDVGPLAGSNGGTIVAQGPPAKVAKSKTSVTAAYLSRRRQILTPTKRRERTGVVTIVGASENNLRNVDVEIPLGCFVAVAGVSGSGKSTLVSDILQPALQKALHNARVFPGKHLSITGLDGLDKCISIDQSPIGRTPRSNPATYTGVFDKIRTLFGELPESKVRGWKQGRFSFNVPVASGGGRCEACSGDGTLKIEMNFLPDVYVPCERCLGRRYSADTLDVKYKGKSIADVLELTVDDACQIFVAQPSIKRTLDVLQSVGLGYIRLGQASTELSGGEAQRVKLAEQLCRKSTGKTMYVLDEPTTGLHFADVEALVRVLDRLVDAGNTVVVIEHNVDVLRCADWVIELGPTGGKGGGLIVASGTPEQVAQGVSPTAPFLLTALASH